MSAASFLSHKYHIITRNLCDPFAAHLKFPFILRLYLIVSTTVPSLLYWREQDHKEAALFSDWVPLQSRETNTLVISVTVIHLWHRDSQSSDHKNIQPLRALRKCLFQANMACLFLFLKDVFQVFYYLFWEREEHFIYSD